MKKSKPTKWDRFDAALHQFDHLLSLHDSPPLAMEGTPRTPARAPGHHARSVPHVADVPDVPGAGFKRPGLILKMFKKINKNVERTVSFFHFFPRDSYFCHFFVDEIQGPKVSHQTLDSYFCYFFVDEIQGPKVSHHDFPHLNSKAPWRP